VLIKKSELFLIFQEKALLLNQTKILFFLYDVLDYLSYSTNKYLYINTYYITEIEVFNLKNVY